ncbi:hypothetical protein [Georgenia satyanarayanai]|uniref:hypothetical protein n=1 Tax=Georgenia satyanarayanai TaxID=860221 RepID=UPI00359F7917
MALERAKLTGIQDPKVLEEIDHAIAIGRQSVVSMRGVLKILRTEDNSSDRRSGTENVPAAIAAAAPHPPARTRRRPRFARTRGPLAPGARRGPRGPPAAVLGAYRPRARHPGVHGEHGQVRPPRRAVHRDDRAHRRRDPGAVPQRRPRGRRGGQRAQLGRGPHRRAGARRGGRGKPRRTSS